MKTQFKKIYSSLVCPLNCSAQDEDTPDHLLRCSKLTHDKTLSSHITQVYATIVDQEEVAVVLTKLMRQRIKILDINSEVQQSA